MQKMILLPYDRYQRLLSSQHSAPSNEVPENVSEPLEAEKPVDQPNSLPEYTAPSRDSGAIELVLPSFPKSLQSRARALLTYISPAVSWNPKGEVLIDGEQIPDSNIVDLVKVQLKDYKNFKPVGLEKFTHILKNANVPLSLLANSRRGQTGQGLPDTTPPPPGSPVTKKPIQKQRIKWLRL